MHNSHKKGKAMTIAQLFNISNSCSAALRNSPCSRECANLFMLSSFFSSAASAKEAAQAASATSRRHRFLMLLPANCTPLCFWGVPGLQAGGLRSQIGHFRLQ